MAELKISDLPEEATPVTSDLVEIEQADGSSSNKTTIQNLSKGIDHGLVVGLSDDDHTQYALLAGRSGGQSITGGTDSGDDLTLLSTSHATKGNVFIGGSTCVVVDSVNSRLGIGTAAPNGPLEVRGQETLSFYSIIGTAIRIANSFNNESLIVQSVGSGSSAGIYFIPFNGLRGHASFTNNIDLFGTGDFLFSASPFADNNNGSTGYVVYEGYAGLGMVISSQSFTSGRGEIIFGPNRTEKARLSPLGNFCILCTAAGTNAEGVVAIENGVAPSTSPADVSQMYSADYSAGNACMHFREEGGAVIKLKQQAKADYNNWASLSDVVAALVAMGIFDAS